MNSNNQRQKRCLRRYTNKSSAIILMWVRLFNNLSMPYLKKIAPWRRADQAKNRKLTCTKRWLSDKWNQKGKEWFACARRGSYYVQDEPSKEHNFHSCTAKPSTALGNNWLAIQGSDRGPPAGTNKEIGKEKATKDTTRVNSRIE